MRPARIINGTARDMGNKANLLNISALFLCVLCASSRTTNGHLLTKRELVAACTPPKFDVVKVTPEPTQVTINWRMNRLDNVANCGYNVSITWSLKDGVLQEDEVQENESQEGIYIVSGLKPYSPVHVTLGLRYTDKKGVNHTGEASVLVTKTAVGKPSPPRNFRVTAYGEKHISLEWESPKVLNGPLDGYEYRVCPVDTCDTEPSRSCSEPHYELQRLFTLSPVKQQQYYWVWLAGYNLIANGSEPDGKVVGNYSALCVRTIKSAPPPRSMEIEIVSDSSSEKTQVTVEIPVNFFNQVNGNVTHIEWLVAEESQIDNCHAPANWKEAHLQDPVQCYSVISEGQIWNITGFPPGCQTSGDVVRCVIGTDEDCGSTICNGKVKEGVTYGIKLRAYNSAGYFDSQPSFFRDGNPAKSQPPSAPRNFTVSKKGPEGVTMIWEEPENPNGLLEGYTYVVCNVDSCGSEPPKRCSDYRETPERTVTVTATPDQYYWVWLAAYRRDRWTNQMIISEHARICFRTAPPPDTP
ncbi:uncharacterized protein LOC135383241 isoform X2 [Ornithodoros turicata]|uniref:uncharacterized protein LOC135383241 isoform X2 n=1 Tax=Ornithodoros turicata TaxID=34597 RepID=UPI003138E506